MDKVVIYGAGNMGRAVWELLCGGCEVIGFMDGNHALRGNRISGIPVWHPSDPDIAEQLHDAVSLVAMTVRPYSEMREKLLRLGACHIMPAGDYVAAQYPRKEILNTWTFQDFDDPPPFADEKSVSDYRAACQWFSRRLDEDWDLEGSKYFPDFLSAPISRCNVMLDTAALDGGYMESFLQRNTTGRVYSFMLTPRTLPAESLRKNYQDRLLSLFEYEAAGQDGVENVCRIGLMHPFTSAETYAVTTKTIDNAMKDSAFDYLRCYSMSKVLPILQGGERSVQRHRPLIAVNIGHYRSDFLQVPSYLMAQCNPYKFYFRMHSYQGNDCILYAVPEEMFRSE